MKAMAGVVLSCSVPLLILLLSCSPLALASSKKPAVVARLEDIPHIKCQVCEKIAREIHRHVRKNEALLSPKRVPENQMIEIAGNVCNLNKEEADWIPRIDIVEKEDKLELVDQGTEGQCNSECKTIERACQEVMASDIDVAKFLFDHKPSVDRLIDYLCNDISNACSVKPPPVPKDRLPGEPFVAKSSEEDLMNFNNFGGEDEDDENEEDKFPANLGKVPGDKDGDNKNFKQRILQGYSETKAAIKKHTNKVSGKLKNWGNFLWEKKVGQRPSKVDKAEL